MLCLIVEHIAHARLRSRREGLAFHCGDFCAGLTATRSNDSILPTFRGCATGSEFIGHNNALVLMENLIQTNMKNSAPREQRYHNLILKQEQGGTADSKAMQYWTSPDFFCTIKARNRLNLLG